MITVNGDATDYAIMKQVQQLKLRHPRMAVTALDERTDFSHLAPDETLYLVSHGSMDNGNFRDAVIKRPALLGWLTDKQRGVPRNFGGIVILSCYSGLAMKDQKPSLAGYLATELAGKVAAGTPVAGANGFSFGTPEFRRSGRSSVVLMEHFAFYVAKYDDPMIDAWLKHKPTHTGGVLRDELKLDVNANKTIREHLELVQQPVQSKKKSPEQIAQEYVRAFAKESKEIEARLEDIIEHKIPGSSVADRADYLVNNGGNQDVTSWNQAIDRQYQLFADLYLWATDARAFTVTTVGG